MVCFISLQITYSNLNLLIDKLTSIFFILLYGSWLAFFYYKLGGPPLFNLTNPDGRESYFLLTTFSNTLEPLRPAGIYDEPGAFSFYICLLVTLRSLTNKAIKQSSYLLLLGLITQSIAHFSFMFIWFLGLFFFDKKFSHIKIYKKIFALIATVSIILIIYMTGLFDWAINRAIYYNENPDATGRIPALVNIYYEINDNILNLFFGFSEGCINRTNCYFGENVLTPLVYGGILASWPYYAFLVIIFSLSILKKEMYFLFGLILILIQRPYFLELPYSMSLCLIITFYISKPNKEIIYYE